MYKIEKKDWGYKLTFSDYIKVDEMAKWVKESEQALAGKTGKFGVFVDMRSLKPITAETQEEMKKGQKLYKQKGMERSVVILDNPILTVQFKRIGKETGIYAWERYIDASSNPNWEKIGLDWIIKGVDPDLK